MLLGRHSPTVDRHDDRFRCVDRSQSINSVDISELVDYGDSAVFGFVFEAASGDT